MSAPMMSSPKETLIPAAKPQEQIGIVKPERNWLKLLLVGVVSAAVVGAGTYYLLNNRLMSVQSELQDTQEAKASLKKQLATAEADKAAAVGGAKASFNQDIRKQDLDAAFRATLKSVSATKATVAYAEMTGDTTEDAVVSIMDSGATKALNVAVYTMKDGKPALLWNLPTADKLNFASAYIGARQTVVYEGTASQTSPTIDTTHNYKWDGKSTFVKQ